MHRKPAHHELFRIIITVLMHRGFCLGEDIRGKVRACSRSFDSLVCVECGVFIAGESKQRRKAGFSRGAGDGICFKFLVLFRG